MRLLKLNTGISNPLNSIFLKIIFVFLSIISSVIVLLPGLALCGEITLAWEANEEQHLAGYIIYYGTTSGNYSANIDVGNATRYTLTDLQEGVTYYLAATAYSAEGHESSYSEELLVTIGLPDGQDPFPPDPAELADTDNDGLIDDEDPANESSDSIADSSGGAGGCFLYTVQKMPGKEN